mmetsp:Transcript_2569/g.2979  ORF Transcript_2569/g.2979 Transcript_2569/m.2979 type:complete len:429 (+) Transcript_2569:488-1774(+)
MLALGLADKIVSSAWVQEVWEPLNEEFQKFTHYPKYPSAQELMDSKPDFLYATYSSAFEDPADPGRLVDKDRLNFTEALGLKEPCSVLIESNSYGENKSYCRDEIHAAGIDTYLASSYCEYAEHRPEDVSVTTLYQEVWDIAMIFDVVDSARVLVDGIEDHFDQALAISADGEEADPIRVFWLDMFKSKSNPDQKLPFVGACCGGPQIVLDKAGAVNVFADQGKEDRRIWDRVEWDAIVETDPDVIVLIELSTESAAEKLYNLCADPVLSKMRAVQERQFLVLPFAASNVGVRLGTAAYNMAEAVAALARGKPLNALEFTENKEASEATSLSGLKVWTTLPTWEGTDLETFCPGSPKNIELKVLTDAQERGDDTNTGSTGLPGYAIALISVFAVLAVGVSLFLFNVVQKEKSGNPMFTPVAKEGSDIA